MSTQVFIGYRDCPAGCVVTDDCLHATVHLSPICALAVTAASVSDIPIGGAPPCVLWGS